MDTPTSSASTSSKRTPKKEQKKPPTFRGPQPMVTVVTGDGEKIPHETFTIHKAFICHHSPFFRAAFEGNFLEAQTQLLKLDDVEGEIFGIFVDWVYTKEFRTGNDCLPFSYKQANVVMIIAEGSSVATVDLCKLWVLAERFLMPNLQNEIIEKISMGRKVPKTQAGGIVGSTMKECVQFVYEEEEGEHEILKRYLIDSFVRFVILRGVYEEKGEKKSEELVTSVFGDGPAVDFIKFLMNTQLTQGVKLQYEYLTLNEVKHLYFVKDESGPSEHEL